MKGRVLQSIKLLLVLMTGAFLLLGSADLGGLTANAGEDQTVTEGQSVTLDGSKSTADEGETLTGYKWSEGSTVYCENAKICTVDNLAKGEHYITLTVTQSDGLTAADMVKVKVEEEQENTYKPLPYDQSSVQGRSGIVTNQSYVTSSVLSEQELRDLVAKYPSLTIIGYDELQKGLLVEYDKDDIEALKALETLKHKKGVARSFQRVLNPFANDTIQFSKNDQTRWHLDIDKLHEYTQGSKKVSIGVMDGTFPKIHKDLSDRDGKVSSVGKIASVQDIRDILKRREEEAKNKGYTDGSLFCKNNFNNHNIITFLEHGTSCAGIIGAFNNSVQDNRGLNEISTINLYSAYAYSDKITVFPWQNIKTNKVISYSMGDIDKRRICYEGYFDIVGKGKIKYKNDLKKKNSFKKNISVERNFYSTGQGKHSLIVFSSGNEYMDAQHANGALHYNEKGQLDKLDNVIIVAALQDEEHLVDYSNYGESVDIAAPTGVKSLGFELKQNRLIDNYDSSFTGTSASAPIVAGVASLIYSINPDFTPKQVKDILINSATKYVSKRIPNPDLTRTRTGAAENSKTDIYPIPILNAEAALKLASELIKEHAVIIHKNIVNNFQPELSLSADNPHNHKIVNTTWQIGSTTTPRIQENSITNKLTVPLTKSTTYNVTVTGKLSDKDDFDITAKDTFSVDKITFDVVDSEDNTKHIRNATLSLPYSESQATYVEGTTDADGKVSAYFIADNTKTHKVYVHANGYIDTSITFKTKPDGVVTIYLTPKGKPVGNLNGYVYDAKTDNPVQNATVTVEGTGFSATTDANGYYLIKGVPENKYTVKAHKDGIGDGTESALVIKGATESAIIALSKDEEPAQNTPPTANNQTVTATTDAMTHTSTNIALDVSDADGDALTVTVTTPPAHGTLSGSGTTLTYTTTEHGGTDSFTYQVSDGKGGVASATVTINISFIEKKMVKFLSENTPKDSCAQYSQSGCEATVQRGDTYTKKWTFENAGNVGLNGVSAVLVENSGAMVVSAPSISTQGANIVVEASVKIPTDAAAGVHKVKFKLVDNKGDLKYPNGSKAEFWHKVKLDQPNELDSFAYTLSSSALVGDPVALSIGIREGNPPYIINIDWGDGAGTPDTASTQTYNDSKTHTYSSAGSYTINVRLKDAMNKTATYQLPVTVTADAPTKTSWKVSGRDRQNNEDKTNLSPTVTPISSSTASYATNWIPSKSSSDYWITYKLPVPDRLIDLSKKVRISFSSVGSTLPSNDRAVGIASTDNRYYAYNILTDLKGLKGFSRIIDYTNGSDTKREIDGLTDAAYKVASETRSYGMEILGTQNIMNAWKTSNHTEIDHTVENITTNGNYLKELYFHFKGNGTLKLAAIEYDKNGNGTYETDEKLILNTQSMEVDWSKFGETVDTGYDLTITSVALTNQNQEYTVTIKNSGTKPIAFSKINIQSYLSDDNKYDPSDTANGGTYLAMFSGDLQPGATKTITLPTSQGKYLIVRVDDDNEIEEDNEENNMFIKAFPAETINPITKVLKTGQTISYTDYDDGYYQKGLPRSYTRDDAKEVVVDNTTGLVWQDDEEAKTVRKTWEDAKDYCQALTLGGYSDWRLPTVRELRSIVDRGRFSPNPTINPTFQNVMSNNGDYWSSTTISFNTEDDAWNVNFSSGGDLWHPKSGAYYIRCVRSDNQDEYKKFTRDDTNEVVIDNINRLMWQDDAVAKTMSKNWQEAIEYCENLTLAGYSDWRLPNINELESIVDYDRYNPSIEQTFQNVTNQRYWSSTTPDTGTSYAWTIHFYYGHDLWNPKLSDTDHVRCVRSADD